MGRILKRVLASQENEDGSHLALSASPLRTALAVPGKCVTSSLSFHPVAIVFPGWEAWGGAELTKFRSCRIYGISTSLSLSILTGF